MTKTKRVLKLSLRVNKNQSINNANTTDKLSIEKEKQSNLSQQYQKASTKRKLKLGDTKKSQKNTENFNVPVIQNEEISKYQTEQLSLLLKQSLHCSTLTQDELSILFMKYKLDGHYKPSKNLPSFQSFLNNKEDTQNNINLSFQTPENLVYNVYEQQEVHSDKNINSIDNKYSCNLSSHTDIENYNRTLTNYDMQTFNNTNKFNNMQNINEAKSNFCINEISNMEGDYFARNVTNIENIYPEEHNSYQYENFRNIGENLQQNEKCTIHFDMSQKSNIYDLHIQNWDNNMSLTEKNNNYQISKSQHSICIPEINNLEWYYSIKNRSEEQKTFNPQIHADLYPVINNDYDTINNSVHSKQDIVINTSDLSTVSDNFIPDTNSFLSSFTCIADQYI